MIILYCTILYYIISYYTIYIWYCNILYYTILYDIIYYIILYNIILSYIMLHYVIILCYIILYYTIIYTVYIYIYPASFEHTAPSHKCKACCHCTAWAHASSAAFTMKWSTVAATARSWHAWGELKNIDRNPIAGWCFFWLICG